MGVDFRRFVAAVRAVLLFEGESMSSSIAKGVGEGDTSHQEKAPTSDCCGPR